MSENSAAALTATKQSSSLSNGTSTDDVVPTAMSTSALESKLKELREKSNKHSQLLTAKLASSQSGQNLLHIGTSLSTLPPDLHSLLTQLHPVLSSAETTEKVHHEHLSKLVRFGNAIRHEQRRVVYAQDAADLYEDLAAAEKVVQADEKSRERERRMKQQQQHARHGGGGGTTGMSSSTSTASSAGVLSSRRQYSFDGATHSNENEDDNTNDGDDDHHDDDQKQRKDKSALTTTAGTYRKVIEKDHRSSLVVSGPLFSYLVFPLFLTPLLLFVLLSFLSDKLDHLSSLERCAQTTLFLVKDLQASTEVVAALTASKISGSTLEQHPKDVSSSGTSGSSANKSNTNTATTALLPSMRTPLEDDTERAQFLMKLAPRIRRLESGTITSLTYQMEVTLQSIQENRRQKLESEDNDGTGQSNDDDDDDKEGDEIDESDLLLMIGHCMRGLALLGRGKEVENIFARVAIM